MVRGLVAVVLGLALAGPASAAGPTLAVGVADDFVKQPDLVGARAKLSLLRLAGLDSVRVTVIWTPGETEPSAKEATELSNLAAAARLTGIRIVVSIYNFGSRTTPLTDESRAEFARFAASLARAYPTLRDFIVGNEPNINRFWLPQFEPDGTNAAAPAYLALLAGTYDALKAVSPQTTVAGGALAPRGIDRPGSGRDTHAPITFIRDLGLAYRASGRALPVMDGLAIHPYGDSSSQAPRDSVHRSNLNVGLADYDKLVAALGEAFDGTAQPGSALPILYDEFGVESQIPAERAAAYTGAEVPATRPVDEPTQAAYYRQAIELAFCQPTVSGLLLFHLADEPARAGWQSGLLYADGAPKTSLPLVAAAVSEARRGVVARCPGLALTPGVRRVVWPRGAGLRAAQGVGFRLLCSIDCAGEARLVRLGRSAAAARQRIALAGGTLSRAVFPASALARGRYRIRLRLSAPVNPGPERTLTSPVLELR
ncbi:MAG: hypothetical protein H0V40_01085 [Actinobacteria bacterium]|nr:hypothetical protein [Actinomycetota bacterium]